MRRRRRLVKCGVVGTGPSCVGVLPSYLVTKPNAFDRAGTNGRATRVAEGEEVQSRLREYGGDFLSSKKVDVREGKAGAVIGRHET